MPAHKHLSSIDLTILNDFNRFLVPTWHVGTRKVINSTRRLTERYERWRRANITFAEFDASIQGWINYVRYADSWGLRKYVLKNFKR